MDGLVWSLREIAGLPRLKRDASGTNPGVRYAFFGLALAGCVLTFNLILIGADRLLQRRRWRRWRWALISFFGAYVGAGFAILPLAITNHPRWLAIISIGLLIGSLAAQTILGGIRLRDEPDSN